MIVFNGVGKMIPAIPDMGRSRFKSPTTCIPKSLDWSPRFFKFAFFFSFLETISVIFKSNQAVAGKTPRIDAPALSFGVTTTPRVLSTLALRQLRVISEIVLGSRTVTTELFFAPPA